MFSKVVRKCYLVVCVCCLMCPKRVRVEDETLVVEQNNAERLKPENVTAPKELVPSTTLIEFLTVPTELGLKAATWAKELRPEIITTANVVGPANATTPKKLSLQTETPITDSFLGPNKPGFDFTEEEMAKFNIWPQGVAPYYIDELSFDNSFREGLRSFLESVDSTGLHFFELLKPPEDQSRWVFFINRRGILGCPDYTTHDFTNKGVQKVILGYGCLDNERALASTVLALAGVPPQHNAPNRDEYVDVNIENVLPDKRHLFKALENNDWLFHDLEYDYNSAGHFDWHKYSANGKATIKPKKIELVNDVQNKAFSFSDLRKIKMLYNFISKHENVGSPKKTQCNHLFVPGSNLTNYLSNSEESIKPLSKPEKYLVRSDDVKKLAANGHDYNITNNTVESIKVENKDNGSKYADYTIDDSKRKPENDEGYKKATENDKIIDKIDPSEKYDKGEIEDDNVRGKNANYTDDNSNRKPESDEGYKKATKTDKIIDKIDPSERSEKGEIEDDNVRDYNDAKNTDMSSRVDSKGNISEFVSVTDNNDKKTMSDKDEKHDNKKGEKKKLNLSIFKDSVNNGGEDITEKDEDFDYENESAINVKLSPFAKKLHLNKKTSPFTQDPLFDKSDYNTEERIQKLKIDLYARRNNLWSLI